MDSTNLIFYFTVTLLIAVFVVDESLPQQLVAVAISSIKEMKEHFISLFSEPTPPPSPSSLLPSRETIGYFTRDGISYASILWDGNNITANPPMAIMIKDVSLEQEEQKPFLFMLNDEASLTDWVTGESLIDLGPETTLRVLLDLGEHCIWRSSLEDVKRSLYIK